MKAWVDRRTKPLIEMHLKTLHAWFASSWISDSNISIIFSGITDVPPSAFWTRTLSRIPSRRRKTRIIWSSASAISAGTMPPTWPSPTYPPSFLRLTDHFKKNFTRQSLIDFDLKKLFCYQAFSPTAHNISFQYFLFTRPYLYHADSVLAELIQFPSWVVCFLKLHAVRIIQNF